MSGAGPSGVSDATKRPRVKPRTLKGFRDYPPDAMWPRERLIDTARRVYRAYGYRPIDTPALEYLEVLTGKGGEETDKQIYQFADHGGRRVGLRFDLTVPLARFAAQHLNQIGLPFKRYHIGPVWRGENTQRGRYREFVQCDFDTLGATAAAADIETVLVIHDLLREIGFERFTIRINHRGVLNGLLDKLGLAERAGAVLRALDKLPKIGPQKTGQQMERTAGISSEQAARVLEIASLQGEPDAVLRQAESLVGDHPAGRAGAARLAEVLAGAQAGGAAPERLRLDLSIARGLDYYTGVVFESFLDDLPQIGSVCSGGRYDNLAELFSSRPLPGVGASLGLDRLLAAMEELGGLDAWRRPPRVFVALFDPRRLHDYLGLCRRLRERGFDVELYPEPKRLGQQLQYADRLGFPVAIIAGEDELAADACLVKDMRSGGQQRVSLADGGQALDAAIRRVLEDAAGGA